MSLIGIDVEHNCTECTFRTDGFFCCLSTESIKDLQSAKVTNAYPVGSMLFVEGQPANGIYVLCQGVVKLFTCSNDGRVVITHVARSGEVLGLSAAVSGGEYEVSAEVLEPCQVNFFRRNDLIRLMEKRPDIAMQAIRHLSRQYYDAYTQVRSFGLSNSVAAKLARLLLEWCGSAAAENGRLRLKMAYTHEEVAEMIGTSRETVTRLLKDFRNRDLISISGSYLYIHDPGELIAVVRQPRRSRSAV